MLVENLGRISESPFAWSMLGLLGAIAALSLWRWSSCPILGHTADPVDPAAPVPRHAGARFFLLMAAGIAATVAALTLIADGIRPVLAFWLMIGGVVVIQTEPIRLELREAETRALRALGCGEAASEAARARLRNAHRRLVAFNFIIAAAVGVGLVAF